MPEPSGHKVPVYVPVVASILGALALGLVGVFLSLPW